MSTSSGPPRRAPAELLARLAGPAGGERADRLLHVRRVPAREAEPAPLPDWVTPTLYAALTQSGVEHLWSHQALAAEIAHRGEHVVLATGTASGKSLGYLLPVVSDLVDGASAPTGRGATALYLAPTKALAHDQLARLDALALPGLRAATYDGDTAPEERRWVREHAAYVLTNPDLLHHSLLPGHERWASFLRALRYVVVDECHVYRGVFGTHLALVLRRLRRVAARYRAHPTFVLASATVTDPAGHAGRLVGAPVRAVTRDGSPRAALTFGLWEPGRVTGRDAGGRGPADAADPTGQEDDGPPTRRRSAVAESADLLGDLVADGVQTVAFARSRSGVEVIASAARERLRSRAPALAETVAAYRGGYLPEERRALETSLRSGTVRGLAATSALELGIDVSGLDAVLLAGWPGTRASLWQQAGRAGRSGEESLAVFVAGDDPLDTYLVHHPEAIFDTPVEAAVVDPDNPHVLTPHLAAAAAELPVTAADEVWFGPGMTRALDDLVARGMLRRRPTGWFWTRPERAGEHVSLRGTGETVRIVEARTGRVLGTIDATRALTVVHPGAVYVHQGRSFVVTSLDLDEAAAVVVPGDPGWSTQARVVSAFDIADTERVRDLGDVQWCFGSVGVRTRVTSFVRRLPTGEVIGEHPLDLPERTLATKAVWYTATPEVLESVGIDEATVPGAAHAAEHAAIGLLPLVATSDRWDVGGVSTARHPDTGLPTVLVYDGHPGGAGFAERGFQAGRLWLSATRDAVSGCRCEKGCPSCVQSPKCGNGNSPLDKEAAVRLLDLVLSAMDVDRDPLQ